MSRASRVLSRLFHVSISGTARSPVYKDFLRGERERRNRRLIRGLFVLSPVRSMMTEDSKQWVHPVVRGNTKVILVKHCDDQRKLLGCDHGLAMGLLHSALAIRCWSEDVK